MEIKNWNDSFWFGFFLWTIPVNELASIRYLQETNKWFFPISLDETNTVTPILHEKKTLKYRMCELQVQNKYTGQAGWCALLPSNLTSYWLSMVTHVGNNNCIEANAPWTRSTQIRKDFSLLLSVESIGLCCVHSNDRGKWQAQELMTVKNSLRWLPRELQDSFHMFDDVRNAILGFKVLTARFLSEINSRVSDIFVSTSLIYLFFRHQS